MSSTQPSSDAGALASTTGSSGNTTTGSTSNVSTTNITPAVVDIDSTVLSTASAMVIPPTPTQTSIQQPQPISLPIPPPPAPITNIPLPPPPPPQLSVPLPVPVPMMANNQMPVTTTTNIPAIIDNSTAPPTTTIPVPVPVGTDTTTTMKDSGSQSQSQPQPQSQPQSVQAVAMKLLDLRLKPSSAIIQSICGEFTASNMNEICTIKAGGTIEIHRIIVTKIVTRINSNINTNIQQPESENNDNKDTKTDDSNGTKEKDTEDTKDTDENDTDTITTTKTILKLICRVETRSIVRCCVAVRYVEEKRDVIAIGSDSGSLSVLDFYNAKCNIIHNVIFGKSACRRIVPGQYIAADPKGRAILIAAIEKRKLVYVINKDISGTNNTTVDGSTTTSTLASPLEANRSRTITYAVTGLDNGYDNPIFATIECQYPDIDDHDTNSAAGTVSNDKDKTITTNIPIIPKQVAYYELDLGLNHVSRKWALTISNSACCIVSVPGGVDGPGGVLIGCEDYIEYCHPIINVSVTTGTTNSIKRIRCPIPRRKLHPPNKGILITNLTVLKQKKKRFFILAQSELGDVYKVTLEFGSNTTSGSTTTSTTDGIVTNMSIVLFDTLPVANSLCISKLGMVFVASEFGNHQLYGFQPTDLSNAPENNSLQFEELLQKEIVENVQLQQFPSTTNITKILSTLSQSTYFSPTILQNLRTIISIDNPSPTTAVMVGELAGNEVSPQIYTLTGRGPSSALRITRHGAAVTELAVTELPGIPGGIFTVADNTNTNIPLKKGQKRNDQYIVVSFADATLVLSIGDTVEEVGRESGLLTNAPTLACSALGTDGAVCQVHPSGVRQIQNGQAKQWNCPGLKRIECASANEAQVLISLAGGEVVYFDINPTTGALSESAKRDMNIDVCSLDVGQISYGKSRSLFAAIACRDQTVRIVSLEPGKLLQQKSSTALRSRPHSVRLIQQDNTYFNDDDDNNNNTRTNLNSIDELTLVIGLDDGSCLRCSIDPVTGAIGTSPTRRFLGARPVAVSSIVLESQRATLLLSSRPWISRKDIQSGKHIISPLSFAPLDHGCSFTSDVVKEGIVATSGRTLRILSVDVASGTSSGTDGISGNADDEAFNTKKVPLRYTPRQMTLLSTVGADQITRKLALVVVESDYNEYGLEEKLSMGFDPTGEGQTSGGKNKKTKQSAGEDDAMDMDMDMDEGSDDDDEKKKDDNNTNNEDDEEEEEDDTEKETRRTMIRGPVPPESGYWGSCIRLLDPANNCASLDCIELGRNEAALCCCSVRFHSKGGEPLLAVGTVTGMVLQPSMRQVSSHIVLYRISNGERFQLLHRTLVDDGPVLALAHFQGRLLVGIGKSLRLYEMGKRQLLRKCELRKLPTCVKSIQTVGDRAYVGDLLQSVQLVKYESTLNKLILIANDPCPRPIVCQELLDWNTIAVGDKFGNISILRLPRGADVLGSNGGYIPTNNNNTTFDQQRALWDTSRGGNDDNITKFELLCQYCVGEVVTSMTRASLVAGGGESLIYVTVTGRVGALVPFTSRADVEFYTLLERTVRETIPRPTGRDPYQYRSYYAPVMHIIDGDLCNSYNSLQHDQQSTVADTLDTSSAEIMKKLEDTRNGLL